MGSVEFWNFPKIFWISPEYLREIQEFSPEYLREIPEFNGPIQNILGKFQNLTDQSRIFEGNSRIQRTSPEYFDTKVFFHRYTVRYILFETRVTPILLSENSPTSKCERVNQFLALCR